MGFDMPSNADPQMKIRLPVELMQFLESEADKNGSTKTSEIVRAIRERKERLAAREAAAAT
jgi:hypothetical protein